MKKLIAFILSAWMVFAAVPAFAGNEAVNINTANVEQLAKSLKGVGPNKAEAIIKYREKHGPIKSLAMLGKIKGIGPKILERNKEKIQFN